MQQRRNITTWRDPLKGLAILWVCFFHARLGLENVPVIGAIQQTGYLGVDIFMLLSGFGLHHSLSKDASLGAYLRRRAGRLLPSFLPVCLLWCACMIPALGLSGSAAVHTGLGSLTMLGYLTGAPYMLNWYLSLLLITILLAPLLHRLLSRAAKPYLCCVTLICIAGLFGLFFIGKDQLMLVSRLPIFVLGMGLGAVKPSRERPVTTALLCWLGFLMGAALLWFGFTRRPDLLLKIGLYWYPGLLMIPGLCAGVSWLMGNLSGMGLRFPVLTALGRASFEIFLFNGWFELYCKQVLHSNSPATHILWMALSIVLGLFWHWWIGYILGWLKKDRH